MKLANLAENKTVIDSKALVSDTELVREIQKRLSEIGLLKLSEVDGTFDPTTHDALTRFCQEVFLDNATTGLFGSTFAKRLIEFAPAEIPDKVVESPSKPDGQKALKIALKFTLHWEGGFVNHPNDLGGATNQGITQATYDSYRSSNNLPNESVEFITHEEVCDIYSKRYWQPSHAELMSLPLAVVQFDTAVLFGVRGAIQFLQSVLGVPDDGIFGTQTRMALQVNNNRKTALAMIEARMIYHQRRVEERPDQNVFLAGWMNRAEALKSFVKNL